MKTITLSQFEMAKQIELRSNTLTKTLGLFVRRRFPGRNGDRMPLIKMSLALLLFMTGCSLLGKRKIEEPKLKLENVKLMSAGLNGANLVFEVRVDNPNPFALELDSVEYSLDFHDKPVGVGKVDNNLKVAEKNSAMIQLPVQVQLKNLAQAIGSLFGTGTTPYHLKGKAKLGLIGIPFEESGDLRFQNGKVERIKK